MSTNQNTETMSSYFEIPIGDEQYGDEQELVGEVQDVEALDKFIESVNLPQ
jgi:hypothetical protein